MDKITHKPLSKKFLFGLFFIALAVFSVVRWDSSAWISQKVNQATSQAGIDMTYQNLEVSKLGVVLTNVIVKQPGKQPIHLDKVKVSPSLATLTSGALGADIDALWLGNPISATVVQDGDAIQLLNIDAMIDVSRLDDLNIPAQLSGLAHLQGELRLLQSTGQPQSGALTLTWNNAKAGLAAPEFTLGDYQVDIHSGVDENQAWPWTISGGSGVGLSGSGTLSPQGQDPKRWLITGVVDTNVDNSNPSLAMMMQDMMGSTQAKFRLSGFLGSPRTAIVR